jgi:holliday junction DNA helicase RuvA
VIARLRGEVLERTDGSVVVDVAGVGYLVHVPGSAAIPPRGQTVQLFTSLQVREDSMTLYGFASAAELRLFELLISSSGVGPKLALATLSTLRPTAIEAAIATGDVAVLTSVPGIGRKVADRLVLELQDRIAPSVVPGLTGHGDAGDGIDAAEVGVIAEVRAALAAFGFTPGEVQGALGAIEATGGESASELLRRALQRLGRGVEVSR